MIVTSIKNSLNSVPTVLIEVLADHPFLHPELYSEIAAAVDLKDFNLPTRSVISKDKNRVTQWMIDDFESFVESIVDLCEYNYNLELTYKNVSSDHSHYYNFLAKDDQGNVIAKFIMRLRISNHDPHRTHQQMHNKKEEMLSEKLNELLNEKQLRKIRKYPVLITVNDELYDTYEDAFADVNQIIEHAVEVMRR